ncbi:MAG: acyltransferase family protein [Butyrivibrio sp.]|nr:acyltransferase family protein [Butyrivibrio sp.]MBR1641486.1 acyltransferase family protein [Butyrivibrio sp.]
MKNKIDYRFKLLYAIGILMVISGHMASGISLTLADWVPLYGVHLPIFAFSSGYFFKESATQDWIGYVKKKVLRLLVPLYIYNLFYGIVVLISRRFGFTLSEEFSLYNLLLAPILNGHQFAYNLGGWFVVPLFMVETFYVLLRKALHISWNRLSETVLFVVLAILGMVGNQLGYMGYNQGWWLVLDRMLYFLPFYAFGFYYKKFLEEYDRKIPDALLLSVLFGIQAMIFFIYGRELTYGAAWCSFKEPGYMPFLAGIVGIAIWFRIATMLEPVLGKKRSVNILADNAYSIMINQFAGFMIVKTVYALISKYTMLFQDFEMDAYKSTIWYCYLPRGMKQLGVFYLIMGIAFPLLVQYIINMTKNKFGRMKNAR